MEKTTKISMQMIENDLVHFIASDAHNAENRPFIVNSLFNEKNLHPIKNQINQFYVNAKKVIEDQDVAKSNRLKIIRVKNFSVYFNCKWSMLGG